jgi:hypothetical protein
MPGSHAKGALLPSHARHSSALPPSALEHRARRAHPTPQVVQTTRGLWGWLLRCGVNLAVAAALLTVMSVTAGAAAAVAAAAAALSMAARQLRGAANLEVRRRASDATAPPVLAVLTCRAPAPVHMPL